MRKGSGAGAEETSERAGARRLRPALEEVPCEPDERLHVEWTERVEAETDSQAASAMNPASQTDAHETGPGWARPTRMATQAAATVLRIRTRRVRLPGCLSSTDLSMLQARTTLRG